MNKIITYGTFDILNYGHINFFRDAKEFGDFLIVGLSSDEFNKQKNKKTLYTFEQRKIVLEALECVDLVISENSFEQKVNDIMEHRIDFFVAGDDLRGRFDFLREYCEVLYLPREAKVLKTDDRCF